MNDQRPKEQDDELPAAEVDRIVPRTSKPQFDAASLLRRVAADAPLVGYQTPAQNALLVGANEIERLQRSIDSCAADARLCWEEERDRLRAALLEYGSHAEGCPDGSDIGDGSCNCGLNEALRPAWRAVDGITGEPISLDEVARRFMTTQVYESGPEPWHCVRCGTTKVVLLEDHCRWTRIGSSQWKYGCADRYITGNIEDMRFCSACGKPIGRVEDV